jgi:AcrR family transcriptional regulator
MGRRKTVSDEAVLDALLAALKLSGPDRLSFAVASRAAGLAAATLVQRFGSREAMVEAVLLHGWDLLDRATAEADREAPATADGAIALLIRLTPAETVAADLTDGLLLLREDFRNPVLRARGLAWGRVLAQAVGRRLATRPEDVERLGWQMARLWQGALIWWGFAREGDPRTHIEAALRGGYSSGAAPTSMPS